MSSRVEYDPADFHLYRQATYSSAIGEFIIGHSPVGASEPYWEPIDYASFSYASDYVPDLFGTLIVGAETATIACTYWDTLPADVLRPNERIRAAYGNAWSFIGIITDTTTSYHVDPEAARHGATRRVEFTAAVAGYYAVMMTRVVSWAEIPGESFLSTLARYITITGLDTL